MKIVILTSETPANVWLVNQLLDRCSDVAGIVIERRPLADTVEAKASRRRKMVERYGRVRTLNKLLFNKVRARFLAQAERETIRECLFPNGAPIVYARPVSTLVVPSINAPGCIQFIRERNPDLLAVCGTTVLKPEVFTLAPKGTINIHTGITPEYRSADPIFWALYRGEPEKVGVTIHYIDRGIDTGPIIHQHSVPVYPNDSLATIYVRCIQKGADLYRQAIGEISDGSVRIIRREGVQGRSFLSVDLGLAQYLLFRWRFRRMASRLPQQEVRERPSTLEMAP